MPFLHFGAILLSHDEKIFVDFTVYISTVHKILILTQTQRCGQFSHLPHHVSFKHVYLHINVVFCIIKKQFLFRDKTVNTCGAI